MSKKQLDGVSWNRMEYEKVQWLTKEMRVSGRKEYHKFDPEV